MYAQQGFGDAGSCPSLEQLAGIVDLTDPCQGGGAIAPAAASCYPSTFVGPIPPGASYCSAPVGLPAPVSSGCPAGSTCSYIAGVPNTAIYTLAAVLAGLFVVSSLGHR